MGKLLNWQPRPEPEPSPPAVEGDDGPEQLGLFPLPPQSPPNRAQGRSLAPDPDYLRGTVGAGQMAFGEKRVWKHGSSELHFTEDGPTMGGGEGIPGKNWAKVGKNVPPETWPAALVVNELNDADFSNDIYNVGGAFRAASGDSDITPSRQYGGRIYSETDDGKALDSHVQRVNEVWGNAPVEDISPDTQLRTGQWQLSQDAVKKLRTMPTFHDPVATDERVLVAGQGVFDDSEVDPTTESDPWIARIAGKNYTTDGNTRTSAARRRGTGGSRARVLEAPDVASFMKLFQP